MPTLAPELDMDPEVRSTWDKQRLAVLNELITKHLIPSFEDEMRRYFLETSLKLPLHLKETIDTH